MTKSRRARVLVSGRVQGVGFRFYTCEEARRRQLGGYVRNLPDGRVEAVFEGSDAAVTALLDWCRSGPPGSRVTEVEVAEGPPTGEFDSFAVRR